MTAPTPTMNVQRLDTVRRRLISLIGINGQTWRKIAAMPEFEGIPPGTLCAISKGRDPKDPKVRLLLHLDKPVKPKAPAWVTTAADHLTKLRQLKLEGET